MIHHQYSNELWKTERKLLHKLTSPQAAATYEPLQDIESTQLMLDMLERPKSFWGHCQRYAGSFIMRVAVSVLFETVARCIDMY